jgi:hypothetical protein
VSLLAGLFAAGASQSALTALPARLQMSVLIVAFLGILFAVLFRRVRGEDRIAGLEAALCREQNARSQADQALAESDLLLERLTAGKRNLRGGVDPLAQLAAIQSELMQLRQHCATDDPLLARRVDLLCTRVACVAQVVRAAHALESG